MSGSPSASARTELYISHPCGSSSAMNPIRANWTEGSFSLTSRYALITPQGSFQGSNLDTCIINGRARSTPNSATSSRQRYLGRARFLGDRGSIAGGMKCSLGPERPGGTNPFMVNTAALYWDTYGRRNCHIASLGCD